MQISRFHEGLFICNRNIFLCYSEALRLAEMINRTEYISMLAVDSDAQTSSSFGK